MINNKLSIGFTFRDVLADNSARNVRLYNSVVEDEVKMLSKIAVDDLVKRTTMSELTEKGKMIDLNKLVEDPTFVYSCSPRVETHNELKRIMEKYHVVFVVDEDEMSLLQNWIMEFFDFMPCNLLITTENINNVGLDYVVTAEEDIANSFDGNVIKYKMPYNNDMVFDMEVASLEEVGL